MLHVRPQHIHRCLACLILATMLMMMPALADSSSLEDDLTSLSDADLLLLKQLVDAEVESRGLLISAQDGQTSDDPPRLDPQIRQQVPQQKVPAQT